jgi:hypothetical protein
MKQCRVEYPSVLAKSWLSKARKSHSLSCASGRRCTESRAQRMMRPCRFTRAVHGAWVRTSRGRAARLGATRDRSSSTTVSSPSMLLIPATGLPRQRHQLTVRLCAQCCNDAASCQRRAISDARALEPPGSAFYAVEKLVVRHASGVRVQVVHSRHSSEHVGRDSELIDRRNPGRSRVV